MYVSGEGSGKERRERRKAEDAGGQRHQITKRQKVVEKFAVQQVKDTIFAGAAALAVSAYMVSIGAPHAISAAALAIAAFVGKKAINAVCRFGKKHIIKKREKGNGKLKKGLILTASGVLPVLVTGIPLTGIVSLAIAAGVMAKKCKKSPTMDEEVEITNNRKKKKGGRAR